MKTKQVYLKDTANIKDRIKPLAEIKPNLVFVFGSDSSLEGTTFSRELQESLGAGAIIIGCSTAGEIAGTSVHDVGAVVTAVHFDKSKLKKAVSLLNGMESSEGAGKDIGQQLKADDLKAVVVFGQGVNINGSSLVSGIQKVVGDKVTITGGLAGDDGKFKKTYTMLDGKVSDREVVAVGFYGSDVSVYFGSMGGWEPFGPARKVTKSAGNVLFELDGKPALAIYKEYLGAQAKDLPASGLMFPLAILNDNRDTTGLIRTILAIDEAAQSLTFAGDIPQDGIVRLMHAPGDGLVKGAKVAAEKSSGKKPGGLALLVSCVGRKLVLGVDVEEEVEAVQNVFGDDTTIAGFYSYGEICPMATVADCKLHNQTMTITYIAEEV